MKNQVYINKLFNDIRKHVFAAFMAMLLTLQVLSQTPQKMSYQAVIRNNNGDLLANTEIGIKLSILEGSTDGNIVYTETYLPTTNANGLISLEIGNSTDFSSIDWGSSIFFVKTEIDPDGGTNYTITGTHQLLSVPYALHSKTAETLTGEIIESDPIYTNSQAANITSSDIINLDNLSGVNTGDQDLSALATKKALEDSISKVRSEIPVGGSTYSYSIGDYAQGGIVFWVDGTGQHGLVCAIVDQDPGDGIRWYNGTYNYTEALGDGIYAGKMNTLLIIAKQGRSSNSYAAGVCANYSVIQGGINYGDWYLPAKFELNLIYANKATINSIATANGGDEFAARMYWSSTEDGSDTDAWIVDFRDGTIQDWGKYSVIKVRAVRAF